MDGRGWGGELEDNGLFWQMTVGSRATVSPQHVLTCIWGFVSISSSFGVWCFKKETFLLARNKSNEFNFKWQSKGDLENDPFIIQLNRQLIKRSLVVILVIWKASICHRNQKMLAAKNRQFVWLSMHKMHNAHVFGNGSGSQCNNLPLALFIQRRREASAWKEEDGK